MSNALLRTVELPVNSLEIFIGQAEHVEATS